MAGRIFTVGQFAIFTKPGQIDRTVIISEVNITNATNARQYRIVDWETGHSFLTFGCWLKKVPEVDQQAVDNLIQDDIEMDDQPAPKSNTFTKERFVEIDENELDNLAANRLSHNTKEQTKWGVKIFRGKFP